jgi:hypothetical protein
MGFAPLERIGMSRLIFLILIAPLAMLRASTTNTAPVELIILQGAAGEKEFEEPFKNSAQGWMDACQKAERNYKLFSPATSGTNTLSELSRFLSQQPTNGPNELWIVFIGHGTFDGLEAKFNLSGPDLSADDLARSLEPFTRPVVLVNTSSSSAPFLKKLSKEGRVIVSATKSGWEENYTRFGKYLAQALTDPASDLDKDGQISVLEAFLSAARQTQDFYKEEKRLATEHALIDDNGDGLGTPAEFFRGVRAVKSAEDKALPDGLRAHQMHFVRGTEEKKLSPELREKRNALEAKLEQILQRKSQVKEEEYLKEIEPILIEIARIYQSSEPKP